MLDRLENFGDSDPVPFVLISEHVVEYRLPAGVVILGVDDIQHVVDQ